MMVRHWLFDDFLTDRSFWYEVQLDTYLFLFLLPAAVLTFGRYSRGEGALLDRLLGHCIARTERAGHEAEARRTVKRLG